MDASLRLEDWIGREIDVVIDRPLRTAHPKYPDLIMELNYGHLPGSRAPDGDPIDVYLLGAEASLGRCRATVIAVIRRRDDVEDKLVARLGGDWDAGAVARAVAFQERYFDTYVEMPSPGAPDRVSDG